MILLKNPSFSLKGSFLTVISFNQTAKLLALLVGHCGQNDFN
ncbi:MAG: hypothetical protein V1833_01390 [Elusimicrobiota bacterium]